MRALARALVEPLIAILLTLALGFVLVAAISDQPVTAFRELLFTNFASRGNFALFLNRATPLILIAVGIVFAFRAGIFNVGGEGQLYLGAMGAAAAVLVIPEAPGFVQVALAIVVAIVAGGIWGMIPGALKVRLGMDEVVTTLMLNFVALLATGYVVNNQLRDTSAYGQVSPLLPMQSWLPAIPGLPAASSGFVVAVVLAFAAWFVLFRTEWGANLRASGTNARFAETVGIRAGRQIIRAMFLSGAFAGLAGALYVLGIGHRFEQNFSPSFGLIALTVALLARIHPIGVLATALFYAMMLNGAAYMQIATDVPRSLVNLLTGLLVLLMTVEFRRRLLRRA